MAYVARGYTTVELARLWQRESALLSAAERLAKFGKPPYYFLNENAHSNSAPTHNQFRVPLYIDTQGRQYKPVGANEPLNAYIKLSSGITRAQNSVRGRLTTPYTERIDFPRAGEHVVLHTTDPSDDFVWVGRVTYMSGIRKATATVTFATPIPQRTEVETPRVEQRKNAQMERSVENRLLNAKRKPPEWFAPAARVKRRL